MRTRLDSALDRDHVWRDELGYETFDLRRCDPLGLGPDEPNGQSEQQAALDEADLRELEHAEYYVATPALTEAAPDAAPTRRTILDRLFRR